MRLYGSKRESNVYAHECVMGALWAYGIQVLEIGASEIHDVDAIYEDVLEDVKWYGENRVLLQKAM